MGTENEKSVKTTIANVGALKDGERSEPLDDTNVIIQREDGYRFGEDAVALAEYASEYIKKTDTVFDLCSGCGIIGILVAIATGAEIVGAEIDGDMCDMANRSAALDGLTNVKFYNADIREINTEQLKRYTNTVDAVVCNPPFFKPGSVPRAVMPSASCEITVTFEDVVKAARRLLRSNGAFMTVFTCSRLDEALCSCRANGLTPKQLTVNENGKTFLLRCVKGGKAGMTVRTKAF